MANIRQILVGLVFWFFGFLKVYFDSFGLNKCSGSHMASKQTKKTKKTVNTSNASNWVHRCILFGLLEWPCKAPRLFWRWSAK